MAVLMIGLLVMPGADQKAESSEQFFQITNDIGYIGNETANTNKDLSKNVYF